MNNTRRNFVKKAGLGLAGVGLLMDESFAATQIQNSQSVIKKVELAIATITMDGFGDQNFEKAFEILPQLPFKNVEFNCWYGRTITPKGIQSIKDRCNQRGLTPICVQGSSFGAEGNIIKDVAHKLWNIHAAKQLGCRRVKFTGAGRGKDGGLDAVISCLKEIAPAAEEMDVLVLVENHANNNIEFLEDYDRIFQAVDSPYVGMCMDNAHFDGSQVDLLEVVDRFHSKILHIDLKDTERFGIHKVVNFGEGVTRNDAVIQKMLEYGYEGYLVIEMAPPRDEMTLVPDLRRAHDLFKKYESPA
ncbi:sugar phosphate isomerase/epimerase family protein [Algoriphagus persicinus]|uniref:sugar phosphate isomerase/epimerase family protein n=1 Tax=Algoriphagus persicinus TaxID=3108754 RepID=UPI002B395189|nr:sugar phosphate isomerase/epimerase family protein [Algoriphagus sp. E1-3-M2]MEB2786596.1 sugar phosphate isomerase/epimerase family protein [Algoriphagus sp. E1-3-M2]